MCRGLIGGLIGGLIKIMINPIIKFSIFIKVHTPSKIFSIQLQVNNMKELFQDIHIDSIMTFLRQINLFNKI